MARLGKKMAAMEADRWCTPTFNKFDLDYPHFILVRMKRDPSFKLACELYDEQSKQPAEHRAEFGRAIARVLLLAEADRKALLSETDECVLWGSSKYHSQPPGLIWSPGFDAGEYPLIQYSMRNEPQSFALALRLHAAYKRQSEARHQRVYFDCCMTVAGTEEYLRNTMIRLNIAPWSRS